MCDEQSGNSMDSKWAHNRLKEVVLGGRPVQATHP